MDAHTVFFHRVRHFLLWWFSQAI